VEGYSVHSDLPTIEGRKVDPRIVPTVLRMQAVMLSSEHRLLRHHMRMASRSSGTERREHLQGAADRERSLEELEEKRARWALLAPPTNPDFWVASYGSLVGLTEALLADMESSLPGLSRTARQVVMTEDLPGLRQQLARYQAELRTWLKRRLRAGLRAGEQASGPPRNPAPRAHLSIIEGATRRAQ
jgi:hypothetical protein